MTSRHIEKIVIADANVLLSALAQKAASRVLAHDLGICTSEHTMGEIERYLPRFSSKYGINPGLLKRALSVMPVEVKPRAFYQQHLPKAKALIGKRDIDDVDILALALSLDAPIWSNDNDFKDLGVKVYTTASILALLEK